MSQQQQHHGVDPNNVSHHNAHLYYQHQMNANNLQQQMGYPPPQQQAVAAIGNGGQITNSNVMYSQPPPQQPVQQVDPAILNQGKMFIGGLSQMTTESSLRQYFENFGEVVEPVIILRDVLTNTSRGFGFIIFRDPNDLDIVLSLTPHIVDGKQIDCKRTVPKAENQSAPPKVQETVANGPPAKIMNQSPQPQQQFQPLLNQFQMGTNQFQNASAAQFQQMFFQQQYQQMSANTGIQSHQQFMGLSVNNAPPTSQQVPQNIDPSHLNRAMMMMQLPSQSQQSQMQPDAGKPPQGATFQFVNSQPGSPTSAQQPQKPGQNMISLQSPDRSPQRPPQQPVYYQAPQNMAVQQPPSQNAQQKQQVINPAPVVEQAQQMPQSEAIKQSNVNDNDDDTPGDEHNQVIGMKAKQPSLIVDQSKQTSSIDMTHQPQHDPGSSGQVPQKTENSDNAQDYHAAGSSQQEVSQVSQAQNAQSMVVGSISAPSNLYQGGPPHFQPSQVNHQQMAPFLTQQYPAKSLQPYMGHDQSSPVNQYYPQGNPQGGAGKIQPNSSHQVQQSSVQNPTLDPQYRKIFVGGLPHNLQDEEFRSYFIQFGEIEDCAILKDKRTGKPRGFGFVTYRQIACVEHVMQLKDSHTIQGKWVDCKRAVPAGQICKDSMQSAMPQGQQSYPSMIPQYQEKKNQPIVDTPVGINHFTQPRAQSVYPLPQADMMGQQFAVTQSFQQYPAQSSTQVPQFANPTPPIQFQPGVQQDFQQKSGNDESAKAQASTQQQFFRSAQPIQQQQPFIIQQGQNGTFTLIPQQASPIFANPQQAAYMLATGQMPQQLLIQQQPQFTQFGGQPIFYSQNSTAQQNQQNAYNQALFNKQLQLQQQQMQMQQLQAMMSTGGFILMPNPALMQGQNGMGMIQMGPNGQPIFTQQKNDFLNQQHQDQTENHIHSLNNFYNDTDKPGEPKGQTIGAVEAQQMVAPQYNPQVLNKAGEPNVYQHHLNSQGSNDSSAGKEGQIHQAYQQNPSQHKAQHDQRSPYDQEPSKSAQKVERPFISLGGAAKKPGDNDNMRNQRDALISNFNEEIKLKENDNFDYESQDSNQFRRPNVWNNSNHDGSQGNQISGFYTHYHQQPQMDSNFILHQQAVANAASGGSQKSVSQQNFTQNANSGGFKVLPENESRGGVGSHQLTRLNPFNHLASQVENEDRFQPISQGAVPQRQNEESPRQFKFSDFEGNPPFVGESKLNLKEPQEVMTHEFQNLNFGKADPRSHPILVGNISAMHHQQRLELPTQQIRHQNTTGHTLKRIESADNIGEEVSQEMHQVRGRHILGSGKDFQFGKDRPSSKASDNASSQGSSHSRSDSGQMGYSALGGFASKRPEFGQIRSETSGQSGPSKRADRQYKPF